MTEREPGIGDVDMIRPERISDEESVDMVFLGGGSESETGVPDGAATVPGMSSEGLLCDPESAGVGRLSDVMGPEDARQYVAGIVRTRKYFYERALRQLGPPSGDHVRAGSDRQPRR